MTAAKGATPNHVPAVVVYATPARNDPGTYHWDAYPVAAWAADGMALLAVPGHARLVPADDPDHFKGECWGVQLTGTWRTDMLGIDVHEPSGNGPFF